MMKTLNTKDTAQVSGGFAYINTAAGHVGLTEPGDSFVIMTDEIGDNGFVFIRNDNVVYNYPVINDVVQEGFVYWIYEA